MGGFQRTALLRAGLVVGCLTPIKELLYSPQSPIMVLEEGIAMLAGAALPCMLLVLGAILCRGPGQSQLRMHEIVGVVIAKLIVMPLAGACPPNSQTLGSDPKVIEAAHEVVQGLNTHTHAVTQNLAGSLGSWAFRCPSRRYHSHRMTSAHNAMQQDLMCLLGISGICMMMGLGRTHMAFTGSGTPFCLCQTMDMA